MSNEFDLQHRTTENFGLQVEHARNTTRLSEFNGLALTSLLATQL